MVEEDKISGLEELKKEYARFKEGYDLPEFSELNKIFDIEEVEIDTEFLLRKIRRVVSERVAGYLKFVEIILNPTNSPMFFFKLIKKLDEDDKKILTKIYEILGGFELEVVELDLVYHEEREAAFIKNVFDVFEDAISKRLLKIVKKMGNGVGNEKKEERVSYFG